MFVSWLLLSFAVWVTSAILPGFQVKGFWGAVIVAAIFGILNVTIGWLLFGIIGIGTLGIGFLFAFLTRWVVNALLLKLTGALTSRLTIRDMKTALLAALIMSLVGTLAEYLVRRPRIQSRGYVDIAARSLTHGELLRLG